MSASGRPQALAALAGCDPIIHAGAVGSPDVLARLGALAPVHALIFVNTACQSGMPVRISM
jgi:hypothetical protein